MGLISLLKKKTNKILFTTPSHGKNLCLYHKFFQWYKADISEVDTLDPETALKKAEERAANIYKTKYTKFLTNGSTSGILAAILASNPEKILIWDKAHPSHRNGALLSKAKIIEYTIPYDSELDLYRAIDTFTVNALLKEHCPNVLVITSPTYEGFVADIENISKICKEQNVILIVDEAHGALYPFSNKLPLSAVNYADFTIQSLHKTAGGINPTALLHSNKIDPTDALNMITTTSPSYPMLATIEANIKFLNSKKGKKYIDNLLETISELKFEQHNDDPTKILIKANHKISEKLYKKYNIEDEKTNKNSFLLLTGIGTTKKMLKKLRKALTNLGF